MKRLFFPLYVFFLLVCSSAFLGAFELEISGGYNGFSFDPWKTSAYTDPDTEKEFDYYPYWLGNIKFKHNISEILNFSLNIDRDNVLQNSISTMFGVKTDFINVNFGIFAGTTDIFNTPDAGIIGNLEFILAETVYLSLSGASTMGVQYDFTSPNHRETAGIKLGFWVGNTNTSVSAEIKSFFREIEEGLFADDTFYRFLFNLEFFIKDSNTSGYINGGYQAYSRVYKKDTDYTDQISAYFAGFGFNWHLKPLGFKFGIEMPVYLSAEEPIAFSYNYLYFAKAYVGFIYSFDK
jgi:hypothetical protein